MDIASRVHEILRDCLHGTQEGAQLVEGLRATFGFTPAKIAAHREEIRMLLDAMPPAFHVTGGGGWSFLNLCVDKDGTQWGEHRDMEALVVLGIAAGMASYQLPRELWDVLPGGMPYVVFDTRRQAAPAMADVRHREGQDG